MKAFPVVLALVGVSSGALPASAQIVTIGPGHSKGLSADGLTAIGESPDPFLWTSASGLVPLSGGISVEAVSGDGARVVGRMVTGFSPISFGAGSWDATSGWQPLASPGGCSTSPILSVGSGTSGSGAVLCGYFLDAGCTPRACAWIAGSLMPLQLLGTRSEANAVSGDGQVFGGSDTIATVTRAALWAADGSISLPFVGVLSPSGRGEIHAVNSDGSVYVGEAGFLAVRKTDRDGVRRLDPGDFSPAEFGTTAFDVSEDGEVVVGHAYRFAFAEQCAMIWTEAEGTHSVEEYITTYGLPPSANGYRRATGVSADGRRISVNAGGGALPPTAAIIDLPDSPWDSLGGSTAGVRGPPLAHAFGPLTNGASVDLTLLDAAPGAATFLFVSTQSNPVPLLSGTLIPNPPALIVPFLTDAQGAVKLTVQITSAPPHASSIYLQWITQDAAAALGASFSNAIQGDA